MSFQGFTFHIGLSSIRRILFLRLYLIVTLFPSEICLKNLNAPFSPLIGSSFNANILSLPLSPIFLKILFSGIELILNPVSFQIYQRSLPL
jgi:hypothetical protein